MIFNCLCLLTMQVLFFISPHEQKCKNFLFCHHKYEIFLDCVHKIKVCPECSCSSIGFRHKELKYNNWNFSFQFFQQVHELGVPFFSGSEPGSQSSFYRMPAYLVFLPLILNIYISAETP